MKQIIPLLIAAIAFSSAPLFAQSASPTPTPAASATPVKHKHKKAAVATASASPVAATKTATKATATGSPAATSPAGTTATTSKKPLVPSGTPAPGGGHGMVWVNTVTHIYHKEGSKWYGRTKQGKYLSELDAMKEGDHASKAEK